MDHMENTNPENTNQENTSQKNIDQANINHINMSESHSGPTKTCKHCGMQIPKKAKTCPYCRKKQKGGIGKIILLILAILVILGAIGTCGGSSDSGSVSGSKVTGSSAAESSADKTSSQNASSEMENSDSEGSVTVEVGQTLEKDGLSITFNSVNTDFKDYEEYNAPDSGKKYIEANFTYENTGDNDAYVSIYDFDCYADNANADEAYLGDSDFMNTNLSSGRNVTFSVYFQVPENAKSIELEYETNVWTSEKAIFVVQ